jgi:hypothetical protein
VSLGILNLMDRSGLGEQGPRLASEASSPRALMSRHRLATLASSGHALGRDVGVESANWNEGSTAEFPTGTSLSVPRQKRVQ